MSSSSQFSSSSLLVVVVVSFHFLSPREYEISHINITNIIYLLMENLEISLYPLSLSLSLFFSFYFFFDIENITLSLIFCPSIIAGQVLTLIRVLQVLEVVPSRCFFVPIRSNDPESNYTNYIVGNATLWENIYNM